jgi:hypothetical protein
MALPVPPDRRALFDPAFVTFHDAPAIVRIAETDPGGAATVDFAVAAPSVALTGKAGGSLYWLKSQRCADGAIVLWCQDGPHVHLVELKQTITAKSWDRIKTQFEGMLANIHAMLGTALQGTPMTVTSHVAFANDNLGASPVLAKVLNTVAGPHALAGAQWAAAVIDLPGYPHVPVNKIIWGSTATAIGCP